MPFVAFWAGICVASYLKRPVAPSLVFPRVRVCLYVCLLQLQVEFRHLPPFSFAPLAILGPGARPCASVTPPCITCYYKANSTPFVPSFGTSRACVCILFATLLTGLLLLPRFPPTRCIKYSGCISPATLLPRPVVVSTGNGAGCFE